LTKRLKNQTQKKSKPVFVKKTGFDFFSLTRCTRTPTHSTIAAFHLAVSTVTRSPRAKSPRARKQFRCVIVKRSGKVQQCAFASREFVQRHSESIRRAQGKIWPAWMAAFVGDFKGLSAHDFL